MGIGGKLGFGKKEPYKAPREAVTLRMKIEAESRENFPHLARYKELAREADQVFRLLDAEVAKERYADEAARVGEDIRVKLAALADRIRKNARDAAAEAGGGAAGDAKMDALALKSVRNSAKTLFAEFLEGNELFISTCKASSPDCTGQITSAGVYLMRQLEALRDEYFAKYGSDHEIRGIRDMTHQKVTELIASFHLHKDGMNDQTAVSVAERHLARLLTMAEDFVD